MASADDTAGALRPPAPPRARTEPLVVILCALASVWLALPLLDATLLSPQWDEFIRLTNGRRVFLGERPYVDYFEHTGTGSDLLYGALFTLLGEANAGAARLLTLVLVTTSAAATYAFLRQRDVAIRTAAVASAVFPLVLFQTWPIPHQHWVGACAGALALAASTRLPFTAGVLLAGALLSSQTAGVVACAAGAASLVGARDPRKIAARVAAGVALVTVCLAVYLTRNDAWARFLDAAILFPLTAYKTAGGMNDVAFFGELADRMARVWQAPHPAALRALAVASLASAAAVPLVLAALVAARLVSLARPTGAAGPLHGSTPDASTSSSSRGSSAAGAQRGASAAALVGVLLASVLAFQPRTEVFHAAAFAVLPAAILPLFLRSARLRVVFTASLACACALGALSLTVNRALAPRPPSVLARAESDDPALAGLSEADALMVQQDRRLLRVRRWVLANPDTRLFAAPVGAAANFFGPRPATPHTLVYDPSVRLLRESDYARVADALAARPADLVMLTTHAAAAAFLNPPPGSSEAAHRLGALLRDGYTESARDGATTFLVPRADSSSAP